MHHIGFQRRVAAPAEAAWLVVSDVGNYHRVAPNINQARVVSGSGAGMVRQCSNSDGAWTELCTTWRDGHSYSFEVDTEAKDYPYPFSKLVGTWSVIPVSGRECEIVMDFAFEFRSADVERDVYPVMKEQFSSVCESLLDNWQNEIECGVDGPGRSRGARP